MIFCHIAIFGEAMKALEKPTILTRTGINFASIFVLKKK